MKKWKIDPITCISVLVLFVLLITAIVMSGTGQSISTSTGRYEVNLLRNF